MSKSKIQWDRMINGKLYDPLKVGDKSWERIQEAQKKFNESDFWKDKSAFEKLKECFAKASDNMVLTPRVYFDHGDRISFGENFYANTGLTILDENYVTFGDNVFLGPHVSIYTAGHPIGAIPIQWSSGIATSWMSKYFIFTFPIACILIRTILRPILYDICMHRMWK